MVSEVCGSTGTLNADRASREPVVDSLSTVSWASPSWGVGAPAPLPCKTFNKGKGGWKGLVFFLPDRVLISLTLQTGSIAFSQVVS